MRPMLTFWRTTCMFLRANKLWEAVLIPFVALVIFWSFLGKFLDGQHSVATFLDNTHFILPLFVHISKSFHSGEFPYWINSIVGGIPLYNNPQFSLLYPFYFFNWNLYSNPLDTSLHVHYVTLFHVAILWVSTYVMMRILHLRVISSVLGATLFAFSANTYLYLFWVNIISPYSWLPLALGSVFLILEDEHPKIGLLLGWTSTYLLVSASPAQPLIHFVFCTGFLAASYAFIHRRNKAKLIAPFRNLVLLAVGSILLSSAILIPTVLFSRRDMVRWTDAGPIVGNQKIPFSGFLTGQARPLELVKVLFPVDIPFSTGDPYLGILPIFLASFSLFSRRRSWVVVPLFLLGAYALLSTTGTHLGLAYINYRLPLWNKIREPGRHLYVFALAFCTLAAFGFEHLLESGRLRNARKHALVFGSFALLLLVGYWIRQRYQSQISDFTLLSSFGLFLLVVWASRFLVRFNHLAHAVAAAIVIYPALYYPAPILKIQEGDYFSEDNLHSHRVLQQLATIKDIGKYRLIVSDKQFSTQYWSMNAAYYDLRTFEAFMNPLPFGEAREMFAAPALPRFAQLLGAKYYLTCGSEPTVPADFSFDRNIEGCNLYSSADAQPYYFLSTEIGLAYKNVQEFFDAVGRSDSDLSKLSISSKNADEMVNWLGGISTPLRWEALREERSRNVFDLVLRTNRRSVLVLNEYLRNEWQVTLDGKTQAPLKVNLNQVGLLLPEGTHEVRFEYRPRLFIWLIYLQRLCFCVLFAGALITAVKAVRRREKVAVEGVAVGSIF
jgi:hypothetical protein